MKKFSKLAIGEFFDFCLFFIFFGEEHDFGSAVEALTLSLTNHVNEANISPVRLIVIAKLDTKHAQGCNCLLILLISVVNDWKHAELSCGALRLSCAHPINLADGNIFEILLCMLQELHERISSAVATFEVFNLDFLVSWSAHSSVDRSLNGSFTLLTASGSHNF